jgi:murein DD-endopeptidase MepM/ murein hydrolase activator NlpD
MYRGILCLFVFCLGLVVCAITYGQKTEEVCPKHIEKQWQQVLQGFKTSNIPMVRTPRKNSQKTGHTELASFSKADEERWRSVLVWIRAHIGCLSPLLLYKIRHKLELESDKDRNRFFDFPEQLSVEIIKTIVELDIKRGAYKSPPTQWHIAVVPRAPNKVQASSKPVVGKDYAMGDVGHSAHSLLEGKDDENGESDQSKLPPLVFTQRDLEKYRSSGTVLSWPMKGGRVGSGFGWRKDPFTHKLRFHHGIDISAAYGTPVYAAASGVVWRSGWLGSCGLGLVIRHPDNMVTLYCHLSQLLAPLKQGVSRGEIIGRVGSTGRSTAPHLHFGLSINGRSVDPASYLPN